MAFVLKQLREAQELVQDLDSQYIGSLADRAQSTGVPLMARQQNEDNQGTKARLANSSKSSAAAQVELRTVHLEDVGMIQALEDMELFQQKLILFLVLL
jgi:hypothetical protein